MPDRPPSTAATPAPLVATALTGLPEVTNGDDLADLLWDATVTVGALVCPGTVLVVSSKVVSKSLGRWTDRDRADVIADETKRVVAERAGLTGVTRIVESMAGPVMAAAGVDASNTGGRDGLLLLPRNADDWAQTMRRSLLHRAELSVETPFAVIISDTAGRPWRAGQTDFALGSAGLTPLLDHRGSTDHDGRLLTVTARCLVDQLAAMADLVKGKTDGIPAALVSGCPAAWFDVGAPGAASLLRTGPADWFTLGNHEAVRAALGVAPGTAAALEVGLRSTAPEEPAVRVERALRVALHDESAHGELLSTSPEGISVGLTATSEQALGRALARFEVALRGEDVDPATIAVTCGLDQDG